MYLPYLRGRQFELIALRELVEKGLISNSVMPIIEPVKPTSTLVKTIKVFNQAEQKYALIMNPSVGDFTSLLNMKKNENDKLVDELYEEVKSQSLTKAYIVKKGTKKLLEGKSNLNEYMIVNPKRDCMNDYLEIYSNTLPAFTLIPEDLTFKRKAKGSKILFMDRFDKAKRNSDYSIEEDEFFSADHLYYDGEGYNGFSDFSIVGAEYNESGFAPLAVAIHIVYFDKKNELRVRHFVSDSNDDINDPAGKFGEALEKLIDWINEENIQLTEGLRSFQDCYKKGKYPGLGTVKKYSIMHHLELVSNYLDVKASR